MKRILLLAALVAGAVWLARKWPADLWDVDLAALTDDTPIYDALAIAHLDWEAEA